MKKITLILLALPFLLASCGEEGASMKERETSVSKDMIENPATAEISESSAVAEAAEDLPAMAFENDVYDFGTITEGEKVNYTFKFSNTGKAPLIITSASASCGCTVPKKPEAPVSPGQSDVIEVTFDSKGKVGIQNKTITIVSNTIPNTKILTLKGEVLKP
ncbi:MAG: hypothetical protein ACJAZ3_000204 [Sphingobacteriales bacterium]|jgi:hypothetical protein